VYIKKVEMNRKETANLSSMKHFKLAVHFFFEKVINKNETLIVFLENHTKHYRQIKKMFQ
jgi:hypothetical protein